MTIGIRVAVEGASTAAGELDKVGDSTKKLGEAAGESSGGIGELKDALVAAGFLKIAGEIKQLAEEGDALGDALAQLQGHSIALAQDVTQHLIPSMELATAAGRLLSANVQFTNEEFAAAAAAAQVFALRTGTDGATALNQLTGALVTGNERGLRPFGIALGEGQRGATGTTEALRQLSAQLDTNRANIAANTGTIDKLGAAYHSAREALGTFESGIVETLGAAHSLIAELVTLPVTLGQGEDGFNKVADAALRVAEALPLVGSAATGAVSGVLDLARAHGLLAYNIARAATAAQMDAVRAGARRPGMGDRLMLDRGLDTQRYDDEVRRDASRAEVQREMYERRNSGGGGGGGGGRTPSSDMTFSLEDAEGFGRNAPGGTGDYSGAGFTTPLGGSSSNRQGARPGQNPAGEARALGSRGFMPTRESTQNLAAIASNADRAAAAMSTMGQIGASALGALTGAVESNVAAWVAGEQSIGAALAGILRATLTSIATESTVKAVFYGAEALAMAVIQNWPAAAAAAGASAQYAATALLAGGGALAMSAASSSGARSSSRGSSARSNGGAVRDSGSGGTTTINNYVLSRGSTVVTESARQFTEHIDRAARSNARRRGQRVPMPA